MGNDISKRVDTLKLLLEEARRDDLSVAEKAGIYASASVIVDKVFQILELHETPARYQVRTKGENLVADIAALIGFDDARSTHEQHYVWGLGNVAAMEAYLKQGGVLG